MKPEQERLRNLLFETITMLCKNGLTYKRDLKIQGLLGITVDDSDVFIIHLNERIEDAVGGFVIPVDGNDPLPYLESQNCSDVSKSLPHSVPQNFALNSIHHYQLFSEHTDASSSNQHAESNINQDPSCCKMVKVEPLTDDCEEITDRVNLVVQEMPIELINNEQSATVVEAGCEQQAAFSIDLACSSNQNVPSVIDYRMVHNSDSEAADICIKDSASNLKIAVPKVSSSECEVSTVVQEHLLNHSFVSRGNPGFTNINQNLLGTSSGSSPKLALPKLIRSFLPMVPGFSNRQQVIAKNERPLLYISQRQASRLPRRPRESTEKHFVCPFCGLAYYYKKHLKFHLRQKHGL